MRHVGDVNSYFDVSVRKLSAVQSVVDVGAAGRVYGANVEMTTIDPTIFVLKRFEIEIEKCFQSSLTYQDKKLTNVLKWEYEVICWLTYNDINYDK